MDRISNIIWDVVPQIFCVKTKPVLILRAKIVTEKNHNVYSFLYHFSLFTFQNFDVAVRKPSFLNLTKHCSV